MQGVPLMIHRIQPFAPRRPTFQMMFRKLIKLRLHLQTENKRKLLDKSHQMIVMIVAVPILMRAIRMDHET